MGEEVENSEVADFSALLEFLYETPNQLASISAGLSDSELQLQVSEDEFSVLENICHLRDLELQGYTTRIKRILSDVAPPLPDFNGQQVAAESNYNDEQPAAALRAFKTARRQNVDVLRTLSDEQLEREGTLAGVGSITLRRLVEMMRDHDEEHIEDLRSLRGRIERCRDLTR
jgi:hypothetical protein